MSKKEVLVIDDEEPILLMTKGMLEEEYNVTTIDSGHAALDLFSIGYTPDLILLDLFMSEMGGWNTLMKIQEACKSNNKLRRTRIAIYTSSEDQEGLAKAKGFGAVDYIQKPIRRSQLLDKVAKLLNG